MFSRRWKAVVLLSSLLAGCTTSRIRPVQSFIDPPAAGEVLAADSSAWNLIALSAHRAAREEDGRMRVDLELRNLSGLDLPVELLTVFHGSDGKAFADDLGWQAVVIPGHEVHHHRAISSSVFASGYRVFVRTP